MTVEILENGAERFVTAGGIAITRQRHETAYAGAIETYLDGLNSRRGAVFSSNYEYPGRYTRWDTAIIDPPVVISARGRAMKIEALNARGEALLPVIGKTLAALKEVSIGDVRQPPDRARSGKARPRLHRGGALARAVGVHGAARHHRTVQDRQRRNLGLYGAFGYDLAFQFDPVEHKLERKQSQRDLVLFLPDEILVVDHYSAKAWHDRYDYSRRRFLDAWPAARAAWPSRSRPPTAFRRAATTSPANMPSSCARRWTASSAATCSRWCPARCSTSAARPRRRRSRAG